MKVDLHVHTAELSSCGKAEARRQAAAAAEAGLDVIVLTDHNAFNPPELIAALNAEFKPLTVYGGIELRVEGEDVLVLGNNEPRLAEEEWRYPELHALIREKGGYIALAHPFRYHPEILIDIARYPVDAIEVYSRNTPPRAAEEIYDLAAGLGVPVLSNSDAHDTTQFGIFYNETERVPRGEAHLLEMLRAGRFVGVSICEDGSRRTTLSREKPCPTQAD